LRWHKEAIMATAAVVKKMKIDRKRIALVHVAKRNIGLTEEEYRDALSSVGAKTAADLYPSQFYRLMEHFEKMGFVSTNKKAGANRSGKPSPSKDLIRAKIEAIRDDIGITDGYIDAIAKHMNFGVDRWKWCDTGQMHKLMTALVYHQKRKAGKEV